MNERITRRDGLGGVYIPLEQGKDKSFFVLAGRYSDGSQKLFGDAAEKLAAYEDAEQSGGWISVKDRLPEENTPVLALFQDGFMMQAKLPLEPSITHWMPLPEPPEDYKDV